MGRVRPSTVRRRVPRSRLPLHRRVLADPAVARRWLVVAVLATLTAGLTARVVGGAEAERRAWGHTRAVLVLDRSVEPGDPLGGAVRTARWPAALVPPGAVAALPPGAEAGAAAGPGVPVTPALVADAADPDPRRHLALPLGDASLPVEPGDRVEVWATVDPALAGGRPATRRVADDAEVRSTRGTTVVVAVDPADVAEVAGAAALATVSLVGLGP